MIYFISDIHLGLGAYAERHEREARLISFLDCIRSKCEVLYIVGDLFDYWFEYGTVLPRDFFRTLAALDRLRSSGVRIEYLMGNHDFGHQDFFERELNIPVHRADLEVEHSAKRFYIAHGDGKVYNDRGYLILRAILRNKLNIKLFQWIHPDLGIGLASNTSSKSREYTDAKDYGKQDGLADFAAQKIKEGFDYVVMGHRHKPLEKRMDFNSHSGVYVNLGDWLGHHTYAEFDGHELRLRSLNDFFAEHKEHGR